MEDGWVGVTSQVKLRGFAKYLFTEGKRRGPNGDEVTYFNYRVPQEALDRALNMGGEKSSSLTSKKYGPPEPESGRG